MIARNTYAPRAASAEMRAATSKTATAHGRLLSVELSHGSLAKRWGLELSRGGSLRGPRSLANRLRLECLGIKLSRGGIPEGSR